MAADVNAIQLAKEGQEERDHSFFTAIYGAQGIKLPPLRAEKGRLTATDFRGWAMAHNAALRRKKAAEPKPGQVKLTPPAEPPPRGAKQKAR